MGSGWVDGGGDDKLKPSGDAYTRTTSAARTVSSSDVAPDSSMSLIHGCGMRVF